MNSIKNNKTQLECIYLMNVALYLPLKDIPTFVKINSKTKDACDGLKVNPIDTINKKYYLCTQII